MATARKPLRRPLDFVAALVDFLVEADRTTAPATPALAVDPLIPWFGDCVLDLASAQVATVAPRGVRLVAAEMVRSGAGASTAKTADADTFHDRDELRGVAPLAWSDQQGQRAAPAFSDKMDLAGEPAPGASEPFVGAVLPGRTSFPGIRRGRLRAPAACW